MRRQVQLISVATAALLAGAGVAISQGASPSGQPPQVAPPPSAAPAEKGPETPKAKEPGKETPRAQQPDQKAPRGAQKEPGQPEQKRTTEQPGGKDTPRGAQKQPDSKQPTTTQQQPGGMPSGQTTQQQPSGATVNLTTEQRTKIRSTVLVKTDAPRVSNVDFQLRVGIKVPRARVKLVTIPDTIVEIRPAWRGYLYFIVGDEIVVVHPRTLEIVAVIPV